jgi:hypothetical protein
MTEIIIPIKCSTVKMINKNLINIIKLEFFIGMVIVWLFCFTIIYSVLFLNRVVFGDVFLAELFFVALPFFIYNSFKENIDVIFNYFISCIKHLWDLLPSIGCIKDE